MAKHHRLKWWASTIVLWLLSTIIFSRIVQATVVSDVDALRLAIEQGPSLVVRVNPGTYYLNYSIQVVRPISVIAAVPWTVRLNGQNTTRIFDLYQTSLTLVNLTLEHGRGEDAPAVAKASPFFAPNGGGCIGAYTTSASAFAGATSLNIQSVNFIRCSTATGNGGAIMLYLPYASAFTCSDCKFFHNSAPAGYGGGVFFSMFQGSVPFGLRFRIDSSLFASNMAYDGGAILIQDPAAEMRLNQVQFLDNNASTVGGALSISQDISVSLCTFSSNNADADKGNAIAMENSACVLYMDSNTCDAFSNNGGLNSSYSSTKVIWRTGINQIQIVTFTPAPTLPAFPPVAPTPTYPPGVLTPTITSPPNTQPPASGFNFVAVGTGVTLGLFLVTMLALAVVVRSRRRRLYLANQQRAAEQDHNAFTHRRNNRPKVVTFTELIPGDLAQEPCVVCDGETPVDEGVVNKCLGTISAAKYKLNSPEALGTTYAMLECGHSSHAACLIVWTEINGRATCPKCRHIIATEDRRRISSHSSSEGSNRTATRPSAAGLSLFSSSRSSAPPPPVLSTDLVLSTRPDAPFSQEARRSTNMDDLLAENAVLVREINELRARSDEPSRAVALVRKSSRGSNLA